MDKKLEEFNWVVGDSARSGLRNTSHTARLDRQALSRARGGHFDSVLREVAVVNSRAIERYSRRDRSSPEGAAGAMDKKLGEFNWVVGDSTRPGLRNTSHSGRMTGVSVGCQMGADHEVLRL